MKTLLVPLAALALLPAAGAQKPRPKPRTAPPAKPAKPAVPDLPLKTAEAVLDANEKATYPPTAAKIESYAVTGRMTITPPGMNGFLSLRARVPSGYLMTQTFPNFGQIRMGDSGGRGWVRQMDGTLRDLTPAERELMFVDFGPEGMIPWRQRFTSAKWMPPRKLFDIWCYTVVVTPKVGLPITFFIDSGTLMTMRIDTDVETNGARRHMVTWLMDYRDVGGVKFAFRSRGFVDGVELIMSIEKLDLNVPVDESTFAKPAAP